MQQKKEGRSAKDVGWIPRGVQYLRDLCCFVLQEEGFGCYGSRWLKSFTARREMLQKDGEITVFPLKKTKNATEKQNRSY